MSASARDLALFNLAIDSKLRASDLVRLKVEDVCSGRIVRDRGVVIQRKTGRPVSGGRYRHLETSDPAAASGVPTPAKKVASLHGCLNVVLGQSIAQ